MDRRLLRNLDLLLIAVTLLLIGYGMVVVYSATHALGEGDNPLYYVKRQAQWCVLGIVAAAVVVGLDYRVYRKWVRIIYLGTLALLVAVIFLAPTIMGADRWLVLGPIRLQPSEFAKIAVIITLARHLEEKEDLSQFRSLISPLLHVALPMGLILLQPDFGTALVFAAIALGMLFFAGANPRHLMFLILGGIGAISLAAFLSSRGLVPLLQEYQVKRLTAFLDPYADRMGDGWNVIQSMIAIGSGGFFGKGLFGGSQTQLNFLPARHTDFIFSVIGEEFGFIGALLLLGLFVVLFWRMLRAVVVAKDRFGSLIAAGVTSMFFFHVLVNIGMTLGIMPVTGITLPFISQGGSSLFTNLIAVGLVLNVVLRRRKIQF